MTQLPPQTELMILRLRNVELRLQLELCLLTIERLQQECATWQQISIAAIAKAKYLEANR